MATPSKSWTYIMDSQIDAESPLDTNLMTQIRDDLIYLKEWLGNSYTAEKDHNHDGVNSKSVVIADNSVLTSKIVDANVTLAKLKLAQGSWTGAISSGATVLVAISRYSHIFQTYSDGTEKKVFFALQAPYSNWQNGIALHNAETAAVNAGFNWDYHTN